MAFIDKTYIQGKEYIIYRNWWIGNYDKMLKELGRPIWLYPFGYFENLDLVCPEFLKNNFIDLESVSRLFEIAVWNTSESTDKWLVRNCPIQSFRNRMLEVYPKTWKGFKNQDWVPKNNKKPKYIKNLILRKK